MRVHIYGSNRLQQNQTETVRKALIYFMELTVASWQKITTTHVFCNAVGKFMPCRDSDGIYVKALCLKF
jgi:hypothetical protein